MLALLAGCEGNKETEEECPGYSGYSGFCADAEVDDNHDDDTILEETDCFILPAEASPGVYDCDAREFCVTCPTLSVDPDQCETVWYATDGSNRSWPCDGIDSDGNGIEDCIDDMTAAACTFY